MRECAGTALGWALLGAFAVVALGGAVQIADLLRSSTKDSGSVFVPFSDPYDGPLSPICATPDPDDRPARPPLPPTEAKAIARAALEDGERLASAGELPRAIQELSRSIGHDPTNAEAWERRGFARLWLGELDLACDDFARAQELAAVARPS